VVLISTNEKASAWEKADATSFLPDFEGGLAFFNADGTLPCVPE
jgi:hypothetical protein